MKDGKEEIWETDKKERDGKNENGWEMRGRKNGKGVKI